MAVREFLVFRQNEDGSFPVRTHEVVSAPLDHFVGITSVISLPWNTQNGDRNATHYLREPDNKVIYSPIEYGNPDYKSKRLAKFSLIPIGDQLDALFKFALSMGLQPDINMAQDTPEGLAARLLAIKEEFPKEDN